MHQLVSVAGTTLLWHSQNKHPARHSENMPLNFIICATPAATALVVQSWYNSFNITCYWLNNTQTRKYINSEYNNRNKRKTIHSLTLLMNQLISDRANQTHEYSLHWRS